MPPVPVPVPLQRSAVPAAPAAVPVQRRAAVGAPPVPGSVSRNDSGARLPTAGAFAVAAGVAQRMADGSVVFSSPAAPPSSGTSRPVVQRDPELGEEPPPADPVPEGTPEPPAAEADASPPHAGAAPGKAGATAVTDELVRALYAPLSRLFKADLRLERERAGFLINTRH